MAKPVVFCVVGTRPDAIKSAPVILELRRFDTVETVVVATGQHREMLAQALSAFGLQADIDLNIMQHGQSLAEVTTRALEGLDRCIAECKPNLVLAQGDTTTTFVAGLASFYRQIPFGHIEAGLRTDTIWNPFPEEFNRRAVGLFAAQHYAPTEWAAENLYKERIDRSAVFVTGNSGIDAVQLIADQQVQTWYPDFPGRILLLTTHRRENWGEKQMEIARSAKEIVDQTRDTMLIVPMHRNEDVRNTLRGILGDHPRIQLIEPPDYPDFVKLMQRSYLILSDSGGVQEEAPSFGIPVLVLRATTERPEGVHAGTAKLVGTDRETIVREALILLQSAEAYAAMAQAVSPYGDGRTAQRVRYLALGMLGIESPMEQMWTSSKQ